MAVTAGPGDVVIAADTIVVCGGRILGKPGTSQQAAQMLQLLSGRDHQVMTGWTVRRDGAVFTQTEVSHIFFRPLEEAKSPPMWRLASRWIRRGLMAFRAWLRCLSPGWRGTITTSWACPCGALAQQLRKLGVRILGV